MAQTQSPTRPNWFVRVLDATIHWFLGFDVFISYARSDGGQVATAIYERLTAERLRCRIDREGTQAGEAVPASLLRAVRRSTVFVLVNTTGAASSTAIREELEVFSATERPICNILVDDPPTSDVWGSLVQGLDYYALPESVARSSDVPEELVKAVWYKHRFSRQATRFKIQIVTSALLIVSAAAATVWFASRASSAIDREALATSAAEIAEGRAKTATNISDVRQRTAEAFRLLERRPTSALQTALDAYRLAVTINDYEKHRAAQGLYAALARVEIGVLPGPSRSSFAASLSPSGEFAAVGGSGVVRLFSDSDSTDLSVPETKRRSAIRGVVISDQGHTLAVTGDGHLFAGAIDSAGQMSERRRPILENQSHSFAVHSPRGRIAIERRTSLDGGPGSVEIWQCSSSGALIGSVSVSDKVKAIDFGPSGDQIVIAEGNKLTVFEIPQQGDPVVVYPHYDLTFPAIDRGNPRDSREFRADEVIGLDWVAVTPSTVAAAIRWPGEILVWDLAGKALEPRHLTLPAPAQINGMAVTPDGRWVVASSPSSMLYLWDISGTEDRAPLELPTEARVTTDVRADPRGRWVATASHNGSVYALDFADPDKRPTLHTLAGLETRDTQGVESIQFSPGGNLIASGRDGRAKVWHLDTPADTATPYVLEPESNGRFHAVAEVIGKRLIVADDSELRLYDQARRVMFRLNVTPIPPDPAHSWDRPNRWSHLEASPDGRWVALATSKSGLRLLQFKDVSALPVIYDLEDIVRVSAASFSQDSSHLAIGSSRRISANEADGEPSNQAFIVRLPHHSEPPSVRQIRDPIESELFVQRSKAQFTSMSLVEMDESGEVVLLGGGGINAIESWRASGDSISTLGFIATGEPSDIAYHAPSKGWVLNPYYPGPVRWLTVDSDSEQLTQRMLPIRGESGRISIDGPWIAAGESMNRLGEPRVNVLRYSGNGHEFDRLPQIELHEAPRSIVIDHIRSELATCDATGQVVIWKLNESEDGWIRCVVRTAGLGSSTILYTSDGRYLIACDASGRIEIWPRPGPSLEELAVEALSVSFQQRE